MDHEAQKAGEDQVMRELIVPTNGLGLARPAGMTVALFDAMVADLCRRLAYMRAQNLAALAEQIAARAGAATGVPRWPVAAHVLQWAGDLEPPPDDASPLLRAIFAHGVGQEAIAQGWSPELLVWARRNRTFPKGFAAKQIRDGADRALRRAADLDAVARRGDALTGEEAHWRAARRTVEDKCRKIAALGSASVADGAP